jgi:hypothetical protein
LITPCSSSCGCPPAGGWAVGSTAPALSQVIPGSAANCARMLPIHSGATVASSKPQAIPAMRSQTRTMSAVPRRA